MQDILSTVDQWIAANKQIALATVVSTWGSSPRQPGAKMAVLADQQMVGSVSGGCVESAVIAEAVEILKDGKPRLLHFGVSDDQAWDVGLACGGEIDVYVETVDPSWWRCARVCVEVDQAFATMTVLTGADEGQKVITDDSGLVFVSKGLSSETANALARFGRDNLKQGQSHTATSADSRVFVDVYRPRPRLVIVGASHVAVCLTQLAGIFGFRVIVIDPRKAFATPVRFPHADMISHEYPDKVLPKIQLGAQTYVVILTHDPKVDDPALRSTLPSPVPYVGVLSSKRTHLRRLQRLEMAGIEVELLRRIRTPIGLQIGAQTPEEIALAIMAEIVAVRNGTMT